MAQKIHHLESVAEYNAMLGVETLHPLVSVVDLSDAPPLRHFRQPYGF